MNTRTTLAVLAACLGFAALECRSEVVVGVHFGSVHVPAKDMQNNANLGLYVRVDSWSAGAYRNTLNRATFYAAGHYPLGHGFEATLGLASGYSKRCSDSTEVITTQQEKDGMTYTQKTNVTATTCRGFSRGALTPLAGITYSPAVEVMGAKPRVWFSPGFGKSSSVVHLSLEKAL
jgi:hypothetical protein